MLLAYLIVIVQTVPLWSESKKTLTPYASMVRSRAVRRFRMNVMSLVEICDTAEQTKCVSNKCQSVNEHCSHEKGAIRTDKMEESLDKDTSCGVCHIASYIASAQSESHNHDLQYLDYPTKPMNARAMSKV